ncbi:MAG: 7-cyano-7-deazaguanine synthase QueC [Desulfovibrionaceae bacterium]|nr:7-cyano-7-deazaguanine synthase QueC [Desulfovibrionaceae bacterium]
MDNAAALVVFSGGQDSATCLAWALEHFQSVSTLGYRYGQRHEVELDCRQRVRTAIRRLNPAWDARLAGDSLLDIGLFAQLHNTSLTSQMAIADREDGLPNTFVPGRNLLFLTMAAAWAYDRGIRHLVTGVCETDSSGYPDCRDDAMKAMQVALNIGMAADFVIHTPLMWIDKAATWQLAHALGGQALVEVILEESHTCYLGDRSKRHVWGYGCGQCPACRLRAAGYAAYLEQGPSPSRHAPERSNA